MSRPAGRVAGGRSDVARTGLAIAVASAAGYGLLALVGRGLSPADFGVFVAVWGVVFGLGSSLSTIEQEAARDAAQAGPRTGPAAAAVTTAAALVAGVVAALTLVPAVGERLFGREEVVFGVVVLAAALGFAAQFAVRGLLVGSGDVRGYGRLVVAEALSRLVVLLALLALARLDLQTAVVAVGVGSFAWLAWARRAGSVLPRGRVPRSDWRPALVRAVSLMAGAGLIASVITGFPTLVTALGSGAPGAAGGAVFAALTVSRVPLLLISPVQALAVPFVVRTREQPGREGTTALRRMLVLGTLATLALGAVGALLGGLLGPWAVRLVYGPDYDVPSGAMALLVLSACLLAWTQLLSATLIALSAHRRMIAVWAVAVGATVGWLLLSPLDVVATTAVGAMVGPVAALACALPAVHRLAATSPVGSADGSAPPAGT
ncbi:Membrane protein involved in the export of O-antigen and teichoic acid [Klenkia soli]|uniref:Membrane protein involved in the export of O-antigen and teichoic acid n=1 Tax=Klenkia soli TaxID=1052260 RepID=A0A1H0H6L5_9ACTN|nr:hypothetical protein [Klenkia soli]SDO14710.1 Membrane protein involved in the export of O-antigen and teichoic acid [Klenkia soli]